MKRLKSLNIYLLLICTFVLFSVFITGEAIAATYYYVAAIGGNDSYTGTDTNKPWATFSKAMTVLQPGDTLIIKDGTYYQSLNVTVSGTSGNPITIKAEHDGLAIIDGQYSRAPVTITSKSYINIEGIICQNSNSNVIEITSSDRVNVKRVSAYNTSYNVNKSGILVYHSSNVLLEDCAVSGWARDIYEIYESDYVTMRRCFGMWKGWYNAGAVAGDNWIVQLYGSSNVIVENLVGFKHPEAMNVSWMGANVWCNNYNVNASNNKYLGTVIWGPTTSAYWAASKNHNIEYNEFTNIVSINDPDGFGQRGDPNLHVRNATFINATSSNYFLSEFPYTPKDSDYEIRGDVRNSNFVSNGNGYGFDINFTSVVKGFTHDYNNLYNFAVNYLGTSAGAHEIYVNPNFNTSTYGKGAYLMVPAALKGKGENGANIGAEVLYRYEKGVLTGVPLWPWPMEQRICNETGYSVTYENGYTGCSNGGGLWKTLDGVVSASPSAPGAPTEVAFIP